MPRVRPTEYKVVESKTPFHGKKWRVIGYKDGQRKQYWFATEKEAKADAADRNTERAAYGSKVNLDSEARLEAFRASELLRRHGKTITDAVRYYLEHLNQSSTSVPFSALALRVRAEFVRRKEANEVSDRHDRTLRETLNKLEARFGEQLVSEIRTEEIREWLLSLPLAAKTRNKHRGYASQVFNLAVDYGYTAVNPLFKIKKFRERSSEENGDISALSAGNTEKLFRAADSEVIPFLTLSFFCGIRTATLEKLDWSNVKYDEKRVIVPRYRGKNDLRYRVTLSENALAWLKPHVRESGSLLVRATATNRFSKEKGKPSDVATRNRILKAAEKAGITLPDNAGRKTFISMHVAHHENIEKAALEADNSPEVIKKDYLDIVAREDAAKFWAIYPKQ
jgi:site-specific recombinase XerC